MGSLMSTILRGLMRITRAAQTNATIEGVRRMSKWSEHSKPPSGVRSEIFQQDGLEYEWLIPDGAQPDAFIYYTHGGGFVFPLYSTLKNVMGALAKRTRMRVLTVDYRLAPEHPFPAAVEDCVADYRWLISEGGAAPDRTVIAGESAGGNLVIATLLALRAAGDPLPAGGLPISAVFDIEMTGESIHTVVDVMANPVFVAKQFAAYQGDADPRDPLLSPIHADLRGLPPLYMQAGEQEMLRSDSERLAARAQEAGVDVRLDIWPEMWHFWHMHYPTMRESREALDAIDKVLHEWVPPRDEGVQ